jgi:uncharacterized protein (TIGR02266 family)
MLIPMAAEERRAQVRIPIKMWVEESGPAGLYFQRATNLSEGGLFLEKTIPHPVGTVVNLQFTLPDDTQPVKVRAEIVNAAAENGELGMGLRFIDLDADASERIRGFVRTRGA